MNTLWGWGRASWAGCGPDVRRGGQTLIMGYSADKSPLLGHLAGPLRRLEPLGAQRQEKCGPNRPTPTGLHEDVEDVTVLIHGAPQVLLATLDRDEHFVEMPGVSEPATSAPQSARILHEDPLPVERGVACISRDPPQEPHYRDAGKSKVHPTYEDEVPRCELAGLPNDIEPY